MSRLTIGIIDQQHQNLKTVAVMQVNTIKQYMLERLFPGDEDADQARKEPKEVLGERVTDQAVAQAIERGLLNRRVAFDRVTFDRENKSLQLVWKSGMGLSLPIALFPELDSLTDTRLQTIELAYGGAALRQDEADLLVSIEGMILSDNEIVGGFMAAALAQEAMEGASAPPYKGV